MIPALKKFLLALFMDETAFLRWSRSLIAVMATSGIAYSQQVADLIGAPTAAERIKKVAVACMGLSLLLGAGDKTPENVKRLATGIALDDAAKLLDGDGKIGPPFNEHTPIKVLVPAPEGLEPKERPAPKES